MASLNIPNFSRGADPVNFVNEAAIKDLPEVLKQHDTSPNGLTEAEAATRLEKFGPNQVAEEKHHGWIQRIYLAARNPLVILLTILAIITFATAGGASDIAGGMLMVAMVVLGISLRFIQETKADNAAAKLKAMISVTATVVRDGQQKEIPLKQLVPGDVVKLSAGTSCLSGISFCWPSRTTVAVTLIIALSLAAVHSGNEGRQCRSQTQGDDQRHRHGRARRPAKGNSTQTTRARRRGEIVGGRHDSRRRAAAFGAVSY